MYIVHNGVCINGYYDKDVMETWFNVENTFVLINPTEML